LSTLDLGGFRQCLCCQSDLLFLVSLLAKLRLKTSEV